MRRVDVRFYAELNDFLPLWRRKRPTTCYFEVSGSVKDMIEGSWRAAHGGGPDPGE
jgi:hypothetical protein